MMMRNVLLKTEVGQSTDFVKLFTSTGVMARYHHKIRRSTYLSTYTSNTNPSYHEMVQIS